MLMILPKAVSRPTVTVRNSTSAWLDSSCPRRPFVYPRFLDWHRLTRTLVLCLSDERLPVKRNSPVDRAGFRGEMITHHSAQVQKTGDRRGLCSSIRRSAAEQKFQADHDARLDPVPRQFLKKLSACDENKEDKQQRCVRPSRIQSAAGTRDRHWTDTSVTCAREDSRQHFSVNRDNPPVDTEPDTYKIQGWIGLPAAKPQRKAQGPPPPKPTSPNELDRLLDALMMFLSVWGAGVSRCIGGVVDREDGHGALLSLIALIGLLLLQWSLPWMFRLHSGVGA